MKNKLYGTTFYGNEASDYAKKNGYLDYATLAKAFDAVLNNDIMSQTEGVVGYWEQESGFVDNSDEIEELEDKISELENERDEYEEFTDEYRDLDREIDELEDKIYDLKNETEPDIFQYYIISDSGANILESMTDEIVFYNETLDMYVWGVTHWGTGWDYVLTNIKLNCGEEAYK